MFARFALHSSVICLYLWLSKVCGKTTEGSLVHSVVPPSKFPYVVGIIREGRRDVLCNGILLTNNFVLTAAECVNRNQRKLRVLVTEQEELLTIQPENIYLYPTYEKYYDDIALIELAEVVEVDSDTQKQVKISDSVKLKDTDPIVLGFVGRKAKVLEGYLKSDQVRVLSKRNCERFNRRMQETEMCAAFSTFYLQNMVTKKYGQFDSGSPLVIEDGDSVTLVGIVSNKPWARDKHYLNFINVAYYKKWIEAYTNDGESESSTTSSSETPSNETASDEVESEDGTSGDTTHSEEESSEPSSDSTQNVSDDTTLDDTTQNDLSSSTQSESPNIDETSNTNAELPTGPSEEGGTTQNEQDSDVNTPNGLPSSTQSEVETQNQDETSSVNTESSTTPSEEDDLASNNNTEPALNQTTVTSRVTRNIDEVSADEINTRSTDSDEEVEDSESGFGFDQSTVKPFSEQSNAPLTNSENIISTDSDTIASPETAQTIATPGNATEQEDIFHSIENVIARSLNVIVSVFT